MNHNNPELRKPRATTQADKDERDKRFISMVSDGVSVEDACIALGYSEHTARVEGYKLKKRLHNEIVERQMARLSSKAAQAVNEIYKLAMSAQQESVRLKSCQDILDRAGFKPTTRIEQETTVVNDDTSKSTADLEAELEAILKGTQLEGNGLDNVTVLPGVDADQVLDEWTPPADFGKEDSDDK